MKRINRQPERVTNYLDKACRYLVKQDPVKFMPWLYGLDQLAPLFQIWLDSRRLALPNQGDLTSDLVAQLENPAGSGQFFDAVIEIMAESRPETIERLLGYIVRLRGEQGTQRTLPGEIGDAIINLTGPAQPLMIYTDVPGCSLKFTALQRTLREEDAARTLKDIQNECVTRWLLPWLSLMSGGDEATILDGWLALVDAESDLKVRTTLAGFTLIFAKHAGRLEVWERVLEDWDMKDSPVILEWVRQGEKRGEARGLVNGTRATLMRFGRKQLGRITKSTRAALESITDLERLERMTDRLSEVETWADLLDTP